MGVVTGLGEVCGRPVVIVANDATVKAGSWWPETIPKMLTRPGDRDALPCPHRLPGGLGRESILPYQAGVFPGKYGASRLFYYNSIMRHYLDVPQISAVMGPCIAGGAYLPALSDVIVMVEGTSFMGLGGPNLVKGATGQDVEAEDPGRRLDAQPDQWRCPFRGPRRRGVRGQDPGAGRAICHPARLPRSPSMSR